MLTRNRAIRIHLSLVFGNVVRCLLASFNILHDVIKLLYYKHWTDKWKYFYIFLHCNFEKVILSILNLHLCSFSGCFLCMLFSSINEIYRLIRKKMSNICLKVTIEKKWCTQNFDFLNLKSLSPVRSLGSSNSRGYHWILKLLVAT